MIKSRYGSLDSWRTYLPGVLAQAVREFDRVIFVTSTAVHPSRLYNRFGWNKKRWMTSTRVIAINALATEIIRRDFSETVEIIDWWSLTINRGNDPKDDTDMRHYGHNTVSEMTQTLLHSVCGDDLLD